MFDFITGSFNPEKTNEYILSIQISLGGFSFSIFSSRENKIVAFKHAPLKISSDILILRHFNEWIKNEEVLQKKYLRTVLVYYSSEFSLIPETLFNSQLVKEATTRLIDANEQKQVEIGTIKELGTPAKVVFYLPKNLKEMICQNFPSAKLIHPVQLIIEQSPQGNKKNKVVLLYYKKSFIVVASRDKQILLANSFNIEHINDLVYFLLNALVQLNLNLKETDLFILEALTRIEELEELLRPYFPEISYLSPSNSVGNVEMVPVSIHRYFSFV